MFSPLYFGVSHLRQGGELDEQKQFMSLEQLNSCVFGCSHCCSSLISFFSIPFYLRICPATFFVCVLVLMSAKTSRRTTAITAAGIVLLAEVYPSIIRQQNKYRGGTSDATTPSSLIVPLMGMLLTTFFPQKWLYLSFGNTRDIRTDGRMDAHDLL